MTRPTADRKRGPENSDAVGPAGEEVAQKCQMLLFQAFQQPDHGLQPESEGPWSCSCSEGPAGPKACSSRRHGEPPAHGLELLMIVQTGKWTGWKSESELSLQS